MSTIDVERLLEELEERRAEHEAASTAIAFNVVAFVEGEPELVGLLAHRLTEIEARNPARSIILTCHGGDVRVDKERVQLGVADLAAPQLQSIVHDLLVPGVRTVLLWAASRISDPRFTALGDLADVVIVFTSRTAESETQMLADIVTLQGGALEHKLRDMAFLRLLAWQDMVAQFFDDPELTPELERLRSVEVVSGTLSEAYYFLGWLASRLDWQPCGKHEFCNARGESIAVSIRTEGPPRRLSSVRLRADATSFTAAVREDTDDVVCLTVEGEKRRPQRCAPVHDVDMIALVERAIFIPRSDSVYTQTLHMVGRLLQHLQ